MTAPNPKLHQVLQKSRPHLEQCLAATTDGSLGAQSVPADFTSHEKFELLSAYMDDEVTAEERALVEHWLSSDPLMRRHYQKQLKLRAAIKSFLD